MTSLFSSDPEASAIQSMRRRPGLRRRKLAVGLLVLMVATPALANEPAKRLLALIDYIGGDYKNAVESGKIINQLEYDEMLEFSTRGLEIFKQLKATEGGSDPAGIETELWTVASHIRDKSGENVVPELAQRIKDRLIATYQIITYPKVLPSLEAGKSLYSQSCAVCHGETGNGDGAAAKSMQPKEPPPANVLDAELMTGLSPFKAFNTTSFGIDGAAMPSFSALDEGLAPATVVKQRAIIEHGLIELLHLGLTSPDSTRHWNFPLLLFSIYIDAVRRLSHVSLFAGHHGYPEKRLVHLFFGRPWLFFFPAVVGRDVFQSLGA